MKSSDRLNKLRDLSEEELEERRDEMSEESFRLRFQWTMGQAESLKKMRESRRDRARVLTLLREKQLEREMSTDKDQGQ
jgi:large subunit ribosomal protein L29